MSQSLPENSTITITRPDDWHLHLRDGDALDRTVGDTARYFGRAIVMPNLVPPVVNAEQAIAYRERIISHVPEGSSFKPLMTLYLTDNTTADDIAAAKASGCVYAAKLYPAGATTNSDSGVTDINKCLGAIEALEAHDLPLLIHGEVTHDHVDIFDREKQFLDEKASVIIEKFPNLKTVLEHITTADAVEFVKQGPENLAATITAHHLLYNRNDMLVGGIRPHFFCLPILKRNTHQYALVEAATSGDKRFFLGTDSAPHAKHKKEAACGCAGCYTSFAAIELYAEVFEAAGKLDNLEAFASHNGPDFYGLPRNSDTITLRKTQWQAPETLTFGSDPVVPLRAGLPIHWSVDS